MATLDNFGIQFASKVLEKFYQNAVVDAIANRDYEGEIKQPGDRVRILSFLNDILFSDYSVGTDMNSETIIDAEDELVVEKRKYYNFSLDRLEDVFTYGGDIPENLLMNASAILERTIDTYVLDKFGTDAKAGSWIGTNLLVTGQGQTMASLTTTSTGGTVTIEGEVAAEDTMFLSTENPLDGTIYFGGFESSDLFKGIRLLSTRSFVTPWWRIATITSTVAVAITEWDEAVSGSDFEENYTLRGTFGGDGISFPKDGAGDASLVATSTLGWEIQAAVATSVSASTIYDQVTLLAERLDFNEVPEGDRYFVLPEWGKTQLRQASETQPTGIGEIYTGTVLNGRIGRIGGFEVVSAVGTRVSTRAGHSTDVAIGGDQTLTAGATGYILPAAHRGFVTFAEKWTESRVVDAENQFARKYQGLFLYGAKVPAYRRKFGAVLFGNV